ncbi:MAG: DUF480 domain-containing protein [Planctomycetales bacterium]|nr:DUF480 domain-containing protein [Planctomycetales bacterium]NIM08106.1 DUF480 domain-containing protein [Planctomycetales bacterium]NIN07601.1 DUF480 domain-containing protein [Planctomycetales bacterium]NIN76723.1 DUF480 domain-containing protein [Planctomycetales bacterium]NIO33912.1 DUF480 domain-containing protein [Planctomycetales bacterium]
MQKPEPETDSTAADSPAWQPLPPPLRRVAGVLVEKAKTTPAAYPLTLNAVRAGCNQKSNRYPEMQLEEEEVNEALDQLRAMGAVAEVHDSGRVPKYRHLLYDWLGVDKVEIAVMAELLLRGAQTIGELRGRSARMEPIADLAALRPLLDSLLAKKLIVYLTPSGRGCVVTHALYKEDELDRLRQQYQQAPTVSSTTRVAANSPPAATAPGGAAGEPGSALQGVYAELQGLRAETEELRGDLTHLVDQLRIELEEIKQQLGI